MRGETASKSVVLHNKEGVAQGCPLAMVEHAILMLPLVRLIKKAYSDCESVWHADDGNAAGSFADVKSFFQKLCLVSPKHGCCL